MPTIWSGDRRCARARARSDASQLLPTDLPIRAKVQARRGCGADSQISGVSTFTPEAARSTAASTAKGIPWFQGQSQACSWEVSVRFISWIAGRKM